MEIKQVRVSASLAFFRTSFMKKHGLSAYHNLDEPAFFFGCYGHNDRLAISKHRGLAVIIWGGSDAMHLRSSVHRNIATLPNVRNVAISSFVCDDLYSYGIRCMHIPFCPTSSTRYASSPLGDSVYVYLSHVYPETYGLSIVNAVRKRLPGVPFIIGHSTPPQCYSVSQLVDVYKKCFIGLRLTKHDGLSNTVVELGLSGRRCVWNGGSPNAVRWSTVDSVVEAIKAEQLLVGVENVGLHDQMLEFLALPPGWNTAEVYFNAG